MLPGASWRCGGTGPDPSFRIPLGYVWPCNGCCAAAPCCIAWGCGAPEQLTGPVVDQDLNWYGPVVRLRSIKQLLVRLTSCLMLFSKIGFPWAMTNTGCRAKLKSLSVRFMLSPWLINELEEWLDKQLARESEIPHCVLIKSQDEILNYTTHGGKHTSYLW